MTQSRYPKAFPRSSEVFNKVADRNEREVLSQYVKVINYHSDFLFWSYECLKATIRDPARQCAWPNQSKMKITISLDDIIRLADIVTREAATVIETALLLTNYAARCSIPQDKLKWIKNDQKKYSLRHRLEAIDSQESKKLIMAIDELWESNGRDLLFSYRNWVTHKGAPQIISDVDWDLPFDMALGTEFIPDTNQRQTVISQYAREKLEHSVKVVCAPFHPNVNQVVTGTFDESNQHLGPPGHIIEAGGITTFNGVKVLIGNATVNKNVFAQNNPVPINISSEVFAGEELVSYMLPDYIGAVDRIVRFTHIVTQESWDATLGELYESLNGRGESERFEENAI